MNNLFKRIVLLSMIPFVGFVLFYIFPYTDIIRYSFSSAVNDLHFSLDNIGNVLQNEYFILAVKNTVIFTCLSIPILVLLGYVLACFIAMLSDSRSKKFLLLLFIPSVIPSVSTIDIWNPIFSSGNMGALLLLFLWKNMGLSVLIFTFGFTKIVPESCEAASIDGASRLQSQKYIYIPTLFPDIIFCIILAIIQSSKVFRDVYLIFGNYPPRDLYLIPHFIFNKFNKLDYSELSAGTLLYTICEMLPPLAALLFFKSKKYKEVQ